MKKVFIVLSAVILSTGCSYQSQRQILKENEVGNSQVFAASAETVYQAFIKSALRKNFIIKEENPQAGSVLVERSVEKGKRTYVVALQARVFEDADRKSSLFLNGSERCERTYVRDNTRFLLFIIPLPGGGGKEASTVVESVKPIRDVHFYREMFSMVKANIVEFPAAENQGQAGDSGDGVFQPEQKAIIQGMDQDSEIHEEIKKETEETAGAEDMPQRDS